MIDDLPLTEALVGAAAGGLALGLNQIQPQQLRRPLHGLVAVASAAAWGLDLMPGRLLTAVLIGFVGGFSPEPAIRRLGVFVTAGALAAVVPVTLGSWERMVTASVVLVVGVAALHLRDTHGSAALVVLGATMSGAFLAAPDTERIALVGGAVIVLAVWSIAVRRTPGLVGYRLVPVTALVVWAGAVDARGRPASLVATLVPIMVLVVLAVLARFGRRVPMAALVPVAAGLAVFVGRVAGLRSSESVAWLLGAAALAVAALVATLVSRPDGKFSAGEDVRRSQA